LAKHIDFPKNIVYIIFVYAILKGEISLKITSVNVRKFEKADSRMRGIASVLIDDCFIIRDIRIIEGDKGLFIAMPSREVGPKEYRDIAHPVNQETRKMFEDAIFEAYNKAE
jgi:stage V sporulation protein G